MFQLRFDQIHTFGKTQWPDVEKQVAGPRSEAKVFGYISRSLSAEMLLSRIATFLFKLEKVNCREETVSKKKYFNFIGKSKRPPKDEAEKSDFTSRITFP